MLVAKVGTLHEMATRTFSRSNGTYRRPTADPKSSPNFRLLRSVNPDSIVGCRRPLVVAFWVALVRAYTCINNHPATVQRQLITKNIRVTMSRLIIRTQRTTIEDEEALCRGVANDRIARIRKDVHFRSAL